MQRLIGAANRSGRICTLAGANRSSHPVSGCIVALSLCPRRDAERRGLKLRATCGTANPEMRSGRSDLDSGDAWRTAFFRPGKFHCIDLRGKRGTLAREMKTLWCGAAAIVLGGTWLVAESRGAPPKEFFVYFGTYTSPKSNSSRSNKS